MKYLIRIEMFYVKSFLVFVLLSVFTKLQAQIITDARAADFDNISADFEIMHIEKIKNVYLIDVKIKDSVEDKMYTIVSLKRKEKKCKRIRKGDVYHFALKSYNRDIPKVPQHYTLVVYMFGYNILVPSRGWRTNVYLTQNLKGLCYICIDGMNE